MTETAASLSTAPEKSADISSLHGLERDLLEGTTAAVIKLLCDVVAMVAPEALGRGQRLRECMSRFARFVRAEPEWELETAALLHAVGWASVPLSLMRKISTGADLDPPEHAILQRVPQVGADLISNIPNFGEIARIVHYQNKNFDGSGFPIDGVTGDEIPLGARMLKILIDRLALETDGVVKQQALKAMKERAGVYDPRLLAQSFDCFPDFLASSISSDRKVLALRVAELQPGQVVVSDVTAYSGLVFVGSGTELTPMILSRLRNFAEMGEVKEPIYAQEIAEAPPAEKNPAPALA